MTSSAPYPYPDSTCNTLLSNWGRFSRIFDHSRCPQNVPKNLVPSPTSRRRHSGDIRTFYSMVVRDGDFYFFTILHFSFFLFLVIAQQSFAKMFFIWLQKTWRRQLCFGTQRCSVRVLPGIQCPYPCFHLSDCAIEVNWKSYFATAAAPFGQ